MNKRDLAIIISLLTIGLLVIAYYVKKHLTSSSSPGTSQPQVTVTYSTISGEIASFTLPQQSGTTIDIPQGTALLLSGTIQPNQTVTVYIYAPNGQVVYQQSAVADNNGQFSMTVPSSNASPNITFLVTLSLGNNYYFYVTVVASSQLPSSTPVPCNQLVPASIQVPYQILPTINLTANYAVNVGCNAFGFPQNVSYEINDYVGSCIVPTSFGQPNSGEVLKIFLFEGTVTDANGNPVCNVPLLYQLSTPVQFPITLPLSYCSIYGCNTSGQYMQLSLDVAGDTQTDSNGHFKVYLVMTATLYNQLTQAQLDTICSPIGSQGVQGSCYAFNQNPLQAVIRVCVQGADGNCVASIPPAEVTTQINVYSTFSIFKQGVSI
jgi:hypothetical protein